MSSQEKVALVSRQTYWGEQEYIAPTLPDNGDLYTDCQQREVGLRGAQRRFDDGQAVYVNGLRVVKAGAA
jgi:hypothetical protein